MQNNVLCLESTCRTLFWAWNLGKEIGFAPGSWIPGTEQCNYSGIFANIYKKKSNHKNPEIWSLDKMELMKPIIENLLQLSLKKQTFVISTIFITYQIYS